MAVKKTTESTPESGLIEQTTPETTPTGVEETGTEETIPAEAEEVAPIILNEPTPERVEPGHPSRDFHSPINQG